MGSDRHIVFYPSPGIGHLTPLIQFANQISQRHGFTATFIIPMDGPLSAAQSSLLDSFPPSVDHILLPALNFDDLPPNSKIETRICLTSSRSLPALRDAVKSLIQVGKKTVLALVVDLFGTDGFDVALELGIPPYLFYTASAMTLSLFLHLPQIDKAVECEYGELEEKLTVPGCVPFHGRDILEPARDRKDDAYKLLLHNCRRYKMAEGIIVNSFRELEPGPVRALQKQDPPVYPVGPLIRSKPESDGVIETTPCLKWLDEQPVGSVLFVSFGSGGVLSQDQIIELAHGLEASGHRFLWVLRCPGASSSEGYFRLQNSTDPLAYLPEGFVENTRRRGFIVPSWAPQTEVLAHPSTGAFLTHCGWNSILETVVSGVPVIAWPLYAEQRMNAVMLHEDLEIALRPEIGENGLVGRDEIASVIKTLMEGEEGKAIQSKARYLKEAAGRALLGEGGASVVAVDQLARRWTGGTVAENGQGDAHRD